MQGGSLALGHVHVSQIRNTCVHTCHLHTMVVVIVLALLLKDFGGLRLCVGKWAKGVRVKCVLKVYVKLDNESDWSKIRLTAVYWPMTSLLPSSLTFWYC